ncbi:hypothetical protein Poli38472_004624 [Pythium oligandrum]|uniref:Protein MON2 homolog n=1 Tax=Pythium oligandrum TaxID=41045 RepID=A0A8K1CB38_PYTOL|nr:hypothetical protein Poli38472_004624 [Pythium oligandrum]|eukprot:TMW59555.1 hypothetical protein Poli38472_004624 [Pythium oligandrum]
MDFLRLLSDDLQALRAETKKKYPVVKEAVDKALETLPYLQKQYAALLRVENAPGPGHPLFKSESVLRPFLLACNHTNASHKILIQALVSIQRLVSWDAIEQSSVGSILRVLQIQAEKNTNVDVQVKLLQTLLQLVTLGYEEKSSDVGSLSTTNGRNASAAQSTTAAADEENALVGNEDLVMQAIWICIHLHGSSSSASSVVGNTAAMTIRQVVSLAFGKVQKSREAKQVGVLVFQELCFMSREESGVWLKRTATSPMSIALGVELLETILSSHARLFREDAEFHAILKQHVCSLIQSALETGCSDVKNINSSSSSSNTATSALSLSSSSSNTGITAPFFPLLVRVMRLASVVLCNFSDVLPDVGSVIIRGLLEIVSTGAYYQPGSAKSPSHAKLTAQEARSFLSHSNSTSSNIGGSGGSHHTNINYVTWPVLLALEVLNRVSMEAPMVAAISNYSDGSLGSVARTVSSVVTTSPPMDFRLYAASDVVVTPRSGLEFLNDQEAPMLQPFFSAIRVAVSCLSNLIASLFDLSRLIQDDAIQSDSLASHGVNVLAPYALHAFNTTMRYCREVELIQVSLKSYHVLATIASRLRANLTAYVASSGVTGISATLLIDASKKLDEVVLSCLRALCAFSFPLPEGIKGAARSGAGGSGNGTNANSSSGGASGGDYYNEDGADEGESCVVTVTWREVHAMKALFSAAHLMEEEMIEVEWCTLLEGFEIIVGLTDVKVKGGQNRLPTRSYRITGFRVEDEDVEQQLVMLGSSIVELFRDALKLSSHALRRLTAALRKVCWEQLGLPLPSSVTPATRASSTSISETTTSSGDGAVELPQLSASHQLKTYQNFLGVGLSGSGPYLPSFVLRMLTQLATNSKRCFEDVIQELLLMTTYSVAPPATSSQFPQLTQFQVFTTDSILQLMQSALQNTINSLSPTSKLPSDASLDEIDAHARSQASEPHIFDQQELFKPLLKLVRSDLKDRALVGILDLLNACGHLIGAGWPLMLGAIQEACEVGEGKTQVAAFKCLRLVVDDLLVSIPRVYLPNCVACIGRFACCAKDVNISLTAVNELWSVADIIGKQKARVTTMPSQWGCAFAELSQVALDDRTEVRNSAINTLFGIAATYGAQFDLTEWQLFVDDTVLPLATKLHQGRTMLSTNAPASNLMLHHSRDSAEKQWDESRVLVLTGISRVLQTNCNVLLSHTQWFARVWQELLKHIALNAARGMSKEVVLAAVNTLQTLLQVSSAGDFDQIAQSQPVRAGAGMRVVGGALVASSNSAPSSSSAKRAPTTPVLRDPVLWGTAFQQLLRLCNDRTGDGSNTWKEDEEQEIASAVVSVLVTLYTQAKEYEFKDARNVLQLLDLFQVLVMRHVLRDTSQDSGAGGKVVSNVTTNSLQSRVLNAFEECGSFAMHPEVHTKALKQLVEYVTVSSTQELVFFTRHALMSLAKLFASVSSEARRDCFHGVLTSIQPFLQVIDGSSNGVNGSGSPDKPKSAAQKAASQLWKHALRVLLVLISHGLAAVRLDNGHWRELLETITHFLEPSTGQLPAFVDGEEDEALVLSVLECLGDSVIALFGGASGSQVLHETPQQYTEFSEALMGLLCSGFDGKDHSKPLIKCCVRQLATLSIQQDDQRLSRYARSSLVDCGTRALETFATLEDVTRSDKSVPSDSEASVSTAATVLAARDRVVIVLNSTCEVELNPPHVLALFPALCRCITSSDLEVRQLIQRLLLQSRLSEFCLELVAPQQEDGVLSRTNSQRRDSRTSSNGGLGFMSR